MLLPDGQVVALGELGSGADYGIQEALDSLGGYAPPATDDHVWQLYSAAGDPLRSGDAGGEWWQVCFPEYKKVLGLKDNPDLVYYEYGGVIVVYDPVDFETASMYYYNGTPAAADEYGWPEIENQPSSLNGAELPLIYEAQSGR